MWSPNEKVWSSKWENEESNFWHSLFTFFYILLPSPYLLFCGVQKSLNYTMCYNSRLSQLGFSVLPSSFIKHSRVSMCRYMYATVRSGTS